MQNTKFYAALLVLVIFAGIFSLSPAISSLMNGVVIRSTGEILTGAYARSGSARDIQAAVDWVAEHGGIGNIYIPEGTFNFVEVEEPWMTVNIPAGVNLFGAPTERDANDQVVDWKTILVMPWDVPGDWDNMPIWFRVAGNADPSKPTRISDIKLVGYRSIDSESITLHRGIAIRDVINFRIDHVMFEHVCSSPVSTWGLKCCGVIDHCRFVNHYGFDDLGNYVNGNIGYGMNLQRDYSGVTFEPTMSVLGQYKDYTVFIEDCYFSKWRHCVASGHGAHYVFRHNTIDQDFGHFSLDAHGLRDVETGRAGTRCAEFYENNLTNAILTDFRALLQDDGGCGVWFNNYVDNSYKSDGIALYPEGYVPSDTWHLKDFYLWATKGNWTSSWNGIPSGFTADRNVLADWDRPAYDRTNPSYPNVDPTWSIAGYKPYVYPHPLTLEATS